MAELVSAPSHINSGQSRQMYTACFIPFRVHHHSGSRISMLSCRHGVGISLGKSLWYLGCCHCCSVALAWVLWPTTLCKNLFSQYLWEYITVCRICILYQNNIIYWTQLGDYNLNIDLNKWVTSVRYLIYLHLYNWLCILLLISLNTNVHQLQLI